MSYYGQFSDASTPSSGNQYNSGESWNVQSYSEGNYSQQQFSDATPQFTDASSGPYSQNPSDVTGVYLGSNTYSDGTYGNFSEGSFSDASAQPAYSNPPQYDQSQYNQPQYNPPQYNPPQYQPQPDYNSPNYNPPQPAVSLQKQYVTPPTSYPSQQPHYDQPRSHSHPLDCPICAFYKQLDLDIAELRSRVIQLENEIASWARKWRTL